MSFSLKAYSASAQTVPSEALPDLGRPAPMAQSNDAAVPSAGEQGMSNEELKILTAAAASIGRLPEGSDDALKAFKAAHKAQAETACEESLNPEASLPPVRTKPSRSSTVTPKPSSAATDGPHGEKRQSPEFGDGNLQTPKKHLNTRLGRAAQPLQPGVANSSAAGAMPPTPRPPPIRTNEYSRNFSLRTDPDGVPQYPQVFDPVHGSQPELRCDLASEYKNYTVGGEELPNMSEKGTQTGAESGDEIGTEDLDGDSLTEAEIEKLNTGFVLEKSALTPQSRLSPGTENTTAQQSSDTFNLTEDSSWQGSLDASAKASGDQATQPQQRILKKAAAHAFIQGSMVVALQDFKMRGQVVVKKGVRGTVVQQFLETQKIAVQWHETTGTRSESALAVRYTRLAIEETIGVKRRLFGHGDWSELEYPRTPTDADDSGTFPYGTQFLRWQRLFHQVLDSETGILACWHSSADLEPEVQDMRCQAANYLNSIISNVKSQWQQAMEKKRGLPPLGLQQPDAALLKEFEDADELVSKEERLVAQLAEL